MAITFNPATFLNDGSQTTPLRFYTGDLRPALVLQIAFDDGSGPVDLSAATVTISFIPSGTTAAGIYGDPVSLLDGPNGIIQYKLTQPFSLPPNVNEATFLMQLLLDWGSGDQQSTDPVQVNVFRRSGH